jgi:hypothetical protein
MTVTVSGGKSKTSVFVLTLSVLFSVIHTLLHKIPADLRYPFEDTLWVRNYIKDSLCKGGTRCIPLDNARES